MPSISTIQLEPTIPSQQQSATPEKNLSNAVAEAVTKRLFQLSGENPAPRIVEHVVRQILFNHGITKTTRVTAAITEKVLASIVPSIIASGGTPKLFDDVTLQSGDDIGNLLKFFLSETPFTLEYLSFNLAKWLMISNREKLKEIRVELQKILLHIHRQLLTNNFSNQQTEMMVGLLMSIYPFFEPDQDELIQAPQKIEGNWSLVTYKVDKLCCSPSWMGSPYNAYGLMPIDNPKACPQLLFMGTPQPSASGSSVATWADFVPGYSVGEAIYEHYAKERLQNWISAAYQKMGHKLTISGQSLGGSLALITASHQPDQIATVYAFNPPTPLPSIPKLFTKNCEKLDTLPDVHAICQENDIVSDVGWGWHPHWNVYRVYADKSYNPYFSHVKGFLCMRKFVVVKVDAEKDSEQLTRKAATILHQTYSASRFILGTLFLLVCGLCFHLYERIRVIFEQCTKCKSIAKIAVDPIALSSVLTVGRKISS